MTVTKRTPIEPFAPLHAVATTADEVANDWTDEATPREPRTYDLERDLESVIVDAARGDSRAKTLLEPAILAMARARLVYADDAIRVTRAIVRSLGSTIDGPGAPRAGRGATWLAEVVTYYADRDSDATSRARYAVWDPPEGEDGP